MPRYDFGVIECAGQQWAYNIRKFLFVGKMIRNRTLIFVIFFVIILLPSFICKITTKGQIKSSPNRISEYKNFLPAPFLNPFSNSALSRSKFSAMLAVCLGKGIDLMGGLVLSDERTEVLTYSLF